MSEVKDLNSISKFHRETMKRFQSGRKIILLAGPVSTLALKF